MSENPLRPESTNIVNAKLFACQSAVWHCVLVASLPDSSFVEVSRGLQFCGKSKELLESKQGQLVLMVHAAKNCFFLSFFN